MEPLKDENAGDHGQPKQIYHRFQKKYYCLDTENGSKKYARFGCPMNWLVGGNVKNKKNESTQKMRILPRIETKIKSFENFKWVIPELL